MTSVLSTPFRDHEVDVHAATVTVDHQVRINPVVVRPVAASHRARLAIGAVADERARLQTETLAELDDVGAVLENAIEAFVQRGNVVAAIQIVIDENLPIAVERVMPLLQPEQVVETKALDAGQQIRAEKSVERRAASVDLDEDPFLPQTNLDRNETIHGRVEIAHAGKIRCSFQLALERVRPSVVRTAQMLSGSFAARSRRLPHGDGRR